MKIKKRGRTMREIDFGEEGREGRKKSQYKRRDKKRGIRIPEKEREKEGKEERRTAVSAGRPVYNKAAGRG